MEVLLITSYRSISKKKLSLTKFVRRCEMLKRRQRLKVVAQLKDWNGTLGFLANCEREYVARVGDSFVHLEFDGSLTGIRVVNHLELEWKHSIPTTIPRNLLKFYGVAEVILDKLQALYEQDSKVNKVKAWRLDNLIIYKDMILLSGEQSKIFIGGELIDSKMIPPGFSVKLSKTQACKASPEFIITTFDWNTGGHWHTRQTTYQVISLAILHRLIHHLLQRLAKNVDKSSDPVRFLKDSLIGASNQEAVPEELNPVLHQHSTTFRLILDYLPARDRLLSIEDRSISILKSSRKRLSKAHIEQSKRIYQTEEKITCWSQDLRAHAIFEENYLIMYVKAANGYDSLLALNLQKKQTEDHYYLRFSEDSNSSPFTQVAKQQLSVLQRSSRQKYFHVLVAGFQAGLLLFTYYEKRFGLSGVFTLPDGKKSSIPVSLCPSSCGKFCYAYTSSEIYRVVIKPDKLL